MTIYDIVTETLTQYLNGVTIMNNITRRNQLSAIQDAVALSLASGLSVDETAKKHDIGPTTIHLWRRVNPLFTRAEREHRKALIDTGFGQMVSLQSIALAKLRHVLLTTKSERLVVDAARTIMEMVAKHKELDLLDEEIDELREMVESNVRVIECQSSDSDPMSLSEARSES